MALFKKKKEDKSDSGMDDGIGLTGSLAESKKSGLFSKKKEQPRPAPAEMTEPASPEPPFEEETIECGVCGMLCPADSTVCEICEAPLAQPVDAQELEEEELPREEPAKMAPEPEIEPAPDAVPEELPPEPGELDTAGDDRTIAEEQPPEPEAPVAPEAQVEHFEADDRVEPPLKESREPAPKEIPIQLVAAEEKPRAPAWKPLPEKERKAAEKAIKHDIKILDKQLKKGQISKGEHTRRVRKLRADHGLEPPMQKRPLPARSPAAARHPEPAPAPEPTREEPSVPQPEFQDDISLQEISAGTEVVDMSSEPPADMEREVGEILPIELLALEELVEEEPQPKPEPAPRPEPSREQDRKVGFVASRKIFGDKKKQLEEWEESLKAEEQNQLAGRADLDSRESKLQEKAFEIQTELQILQTKKKDMTVRAEAMAKREAELQDIGAKLAQRAEAMDLRDAEIAKREESISEKLSALDAREAEITERLSILEKKEKDVVSRESETREKWLEMREFDRTLSARTEELEAAEEEFNEKRMAQRKRDAELDDKRRELDARNRELESKTRELNTLQEQIAAREEKLIAEAESNKEMSKKLEESFAQIDAKTEEIEAKETDLAEREERQEAWKKRLEAKESELAVKSNELSSKEGAIRTAERELDGRKEKLKARLMELKALEDQTLLRKREVDEVELLLIQKENELFNREQGLSRKEAAK